MLKKCAHICLVPLLSLAIFGCSHSEKTARAIRVGMTKAEVLEIAGNPRHTGRQHGSDVWTYSPVGAEAEPTKLFFQEGKVAYITTGDAVPAPLKPAESKSGKGFQPVGN